MGDAYVFLPIPLIGGAVALLIGLLVFAVRRSDAAPSRAQKGAGWALVAGAALITLDLVTSNTYGMFFFLPWPSMLLVVAALAVALVLLRTPSLLPSSLWGNITRWGPLATSVLVLVYLLVSGEAGWAVIAPAAAILALVQASQLVPFTIFGVKPADIVLSGLGLLAGLYMFFNYEDIARNPGGATDPGYVAVGTIGILLILVATYRVLGGALVVLASVMLFYSYAGPSMPGFLRHGGFSVEGTIDNLYVGTTGVFGIPLGISATFIFVFMIFAAMLQRTGMERFFTDLALGSTGWATGGTGKVSVITSAFAGTITGSSVANTVSNGAFTIPMMMKSGYSKEYSGGVEASSSTGGQIAPPIMGAGAFIMIEFTQATYQQILQAAIIPAIFFFLSQFVVIHYDSKRLGIGGLPKNMLPNVRRLMATRGYLLIPVIAIFVLLSMGYSPLPAAMGAVVTTVALNFVAQLVAMPWSVIDGRLRLRAVGEIARDSVAFALPIIVAGGGAVLVVQLIQVFLGTAHRGVQALFIALLVAALTILVAALFRNWKRDGADQLDLHKLLDGLVAASRIALPIILACAAAGLISGVITTTDLGLKLSSGLLGIATSISDVIVSAIGFLPVVGGDLAAMAAEGSVELVPLLFMSMLACLILGIGLPTTANYVITATLAAPAIVAVLQADLDSPTLSMLLMAHMFVYYFGIMADITPPVCLACYAACGISGGHPIRTGVQAVRIAVAGFVVPFMFVISPQLLLQNVTIATGILAGVTGALGVSLVSVAVAGFINRPLNVSTRLLIAVSGLLLLHFGWLTDVIGFAMATVIFAAHYWNTRGTPKTAHDMSNATT
ncbi:TRAP transporter fused permease subunit [Spiractinospora alimapuensis]|nr:TRAP transporter fused permease subunit [Spiractinospora alimapuensis]